MLCTRRFSAQPTQAHSVGSSMMASGSGSGSGSGSMTPWALLGSTYPTDVTRVPFAGFGTTDQTERAGARFASTFLT